MSHPSRSPLRDLVALHVEAVLRERRRRRRRKPGGPRTDMGALRQLDPGAFKAQVSSAVAGAKGDVEHAARKIDVSPRTLYHYLDTEPGLEGVETSSEREEPGERER